jgi:hypothetical protein
MHEFLLILRGNGMDNMSPDELQKLMAGYKAWAAEAGERYITGQRLEKTGALLTGVSEPIMTDGPFLESKEIIAGYMLVQAENQDDAIALAKKLPHLGSYHIEVRPLAWPKMK